MLGFFETANICASGMTAQRARIDVIASNISNAETTRAENGEPYRRKAVIFAEVLNKELENISTNDKEGLGGVKILKIEEDKRPFQLVYNPDHPDADENGYVETLYGRRIYLPQLRSSNYNQRTGAERVAMNAPIQGTAADIMKRAMIAVYDALKAEKLKSKLIT